MSDEPIPTEATNAWAITNPLREVPLTPEAADALGNASAAVQQAQALRDAILTGIVASAGIKGGQVVEVRPGPPTVLVVQP